MPAPKDPEKRKLWKQNISKNTTLAMSRPNVRNKMTGKNHPMYGKKQTIESNEKNRRSQYKRYKNNPVTQETKEKHRLKALKQFKNGMPQKTKDKIKQTLLKKYQDPEYKKNIHEKHLKALQRPDVIANMSKAQQGNTNGFKKNNTLAVGSKNGRWLGGKSFEPYSTEWTNKLKQTIRERDNYTCQECNNYGNIVHHVDYNKKNCSPENLITLCRKCHSITNGCRKYWTKYFQNKLQQLTYNL